MHFPLAPRHRTHPYAPVRVNEALGLLTALERAAFTLRHVEGMSIEEVGDKLGLKTSATKHSIFRAVKKMRNALEPFVQS